MKVEDIALSVQCESSQAVTACLYQIRQNFYQDRRIVSSQKRRYRATPKIGTRSAYHTRCDHGHGRTCQASDLIHPAHGQPSVYVGSLDFRGCSAYPDRGFMVSEKKSWTCRFVEHLPKVSSAQERASR